MMKTAENISALQAQLQQLFTEYYYAFKQQNIAEVLACYQLPCSLATPDRLVLLNSHQDGEQEFAQIFAGINELQITSFRSLSASFQPIDELLTQVNIHWQFSNANNEILADFAALYHIVKNKHRLAIFQVISHHNEPPIELPFSLTLTEIEK